jgi:hypothetical protein
MKTNTAIPDRSKMFVIAIDKVKVRQHFSLIQKMFDDKKAYNRRSFKRGNDE